MSAAQAVFLAGLVLVLFAVVAFSAFVFRAAAAAAGGGGTAFTARLLVPRARRAELGSAAFLAHRITGFAIFAFLALHILDIGLYSISQRLYDDVQRLYGTAPLRVFECCLLLAVLFHTGNGLRLLAIDAGRLPATWARRLLVIVLAVVAVSGAGGSALILAPLVT